MAALSCGVAVASSFLTIRHRELRNSLRHALLISPAAIHMVAVLRGYIRYPSYVLSLSPTGYRLGGDHIQPSTTLPFGQSS